MAVFKRTVLLVTLVASGFLGGVQVAEAAKRLPLEKRVQRLERMLDNRVLVQLLQRIEGLQQEVRTLRGQVELQANEVKMMSKRNRDLYLDTDSRLQAVEGNKTSALFDQKTVAPIASVGVARPEVLALVEPPVTPKTERAAYEQAYMSLVNGRYRAASQGFRDVLSEYPDGKLMDHSHYWLGESYYVEQKYPEARAQFEAVIKNSPGSSKIAEAHLKLGLVLYEQGHVKAATATLQSVLENFPQSTAFLLAERRLEEIAGE